MVPALRYVVMLDMGVTDCLSQRSEVNVAAELGELLLNGGVKDREKLFADLGPEPLRTRCLASGCRNPALAALGKDCERLPKLMEQLLSAPVPHQHVLNAQAAGIAGLHRTKAGDRTLGSADLHTCPFTVEATGFRPS